MSFRDCKNEFQHSHVFLGSGHDENARRTTWVVWLTAAMMVVEIIAGYITGSMALLADGFHMATHAGALGVAALAYGYAKRHASDPRYSFGTGKVGDLAGFASALVLGIVALGIGFESISRLFAPIRVAFTEAAFVAVVGLVVNAVSALLLSGGHRHSHGHDHDHLHDHSGTDNNLRAAYAHVVADALTSILAIIALVSGRYLGWVWLDPVMGIVGAVLIARWSLRLMGDASIVLLDRTDEHVAQEVREIMAKAEGVEIADLHIWRLGPEAHGGILSIVTRQPMERSKLLELLTPIHELRHLTLEIHEPVTA